MNFLILFLLSVKITIKGVVRDELTHEPLSYAAVVLFDGKTNRIIQGTLADEKGIFLLPKIKPGNYYIKVDFIGYKSKTTKTFTVARKHIFDIGTIYLKPAGIRMDTLTVSAKRPSLELKIDRTLLRPQNDIISSNGTAKDLLKTAPSVSTSPDGKILIRNSQNFKVLINGNPTLLPKDEALSQIPASQIKYIEVITNPSCEYDPEANAIVNIVLKKSEFEKGVEITGGIGTYSNYNLGLLGSLCKDKNSIYSSVNYRNLTQDLYLHMRMINPTYTIITDTALFKISRTPLTLQLGSSFNVFNNIGVNLVVNGGRNRVEGHGATHYKIDTCQIENISDLLWLYRFWDASFNLSSSHLTFSTFYGVLSSQKDLNTPSKEGDSVNGGLIAQGEGERQLLQVDIKGNTTLKTLKINSGIRITSKDFNSNTQTLFYSQNNSHTDTLNSRKTIYAGFIKFRTKAIRKFAFSGGIRLEKTYRTINTYEFNSFDCFPSVYVNYQLSPYTTLSLGLSRRINRPSDYALNPVEVWENPQLKHVGNPKLLPSTTDELELRYSFPFGKKIYVSGSIYNSRVKNELGKYESVDSSIVISRIVNFKRSNYYGTEVMINVSISRKLNLMTSLDIERYTRSDSLIGTQKGLFYHLKGFFNCILPIGNLQVQGMYIGPYQETFGKLNAMYGLNLGYMLKWHNLQMSLSASDILHSMKLVSHSDNLQKIAYQCYPSITLQITFNLDQKARIEKNLNKQNEDYKAM